MGAKFLGKPIECFLSGYRTISNTVNSVISLNETIIVQYTVPGGQEFSLVGGSATGMTDTTFRIYVDDVLKEEKNNAWTKRNVNLDVMENVSSGKIIKITAYMRKITTPHDFTASIFGILS